MGVGPSSEMSPDDVPAVWETSLGTIQDYDGLPVWLVRFATKGKAAMATLTSTDGERRTVEWAWGDVGYGYDVRTTDPTPEWLLGLIDTWYDQMACVLGHLHCEKHDR